MKISRTVVLSIFFSFSIIFLQEGFSYYLSVQSIALFFILMIILVSKPLLVNTKQIVTVFFLLSSMIIITMDLSPMVISRNSSNIIFTVVAIFFYSLFIICLPNIVLMRLYLILNLFKYTSIFTVTLLTFFVFLQELPFVPFLNRKFFYLQNSRLVTNYMANEASLNIKENNLRIDLFYGEPSYLAAVLFSCLTCYILTSMLLSDYMFNIRFKSKSLRESFQKFRYNKYLVMMGVMPLLYIRSLSSILYGLIILLFVFKQQIRNRLTYSNITAFIIFMIIIAFIFSNSYDYFFYRIFSIRDSESLSDRFGSLLNFSFMDYILGLKEGTKIPEEGFHNGLFYIVAISGFSGILYLVSLIRSVYILAKPVRMSMLLIFTLLALIMQNGAIFSPNKVVLMSLILLPLSCVRTIYNKKNMVLPRKALHE